MNLGIHLKTFLYGTLVGKDELGNRYYLGKKTSYKGLRERWVIYQGEAEASAVPPSWHNWLHYSTDTPPAPDAKIYAWQKPPSPNKTGSKDAILPPGHILRGGKRKKVSSDYEAWKP